MWTFLFSAVGPLAIRALTLIGFSAVTFTGVMELVNALISQAQSSWSTMPVVMLSLASLAGVPQALGLIFGAIVARATLWIGASASKLLFKP